MFDIGGWELLVIGSIALIIVGPKDLPRMIRSVGQWVGKARGLAREFQTGMEEAAREADVAELKQLTKPDLGVQSEIDALNDEIRAVDAEMSRSAGASPSVTPVRETAAQPSAQTATGPATPAAGARPAATAYPSDRDADAPAGAVSQPRSDEEAFLERFERGVKDRA